MVISKKSSQMIYHEETCPYAKRISTKHRRFISERRALEKGYHSCAYCGGLHGLYVKLKADPTMYGGLMNHVSTSYDRIDKGLCFRTDIGFWKVLENGNPAAYKLWHLNQGNFDKSVPDKALMRRNFHRQSDVKSTLNMQRLVQYIVDHDRAKKIINDDWKKLPKKTSKQRKYYKQAKRREEKKQHKRLDQLFEMIEKGKI